MYLRYVCTPVAFDNVFKVCIRLMSEKDSEGGPFFTFFLILFFFFVYDNGIQIPL